MDPMYRLAKPIYCSFFPFELYIHMRLNTGQLCQALAFKSAILMVHLHLCDMLRELGMARTHLTAQWLQLTLQPWTSIKYRGTLLGFWDIHFYMFRF
jgi:hypothetical protein